MKKKKNSLWVKDNLNILMVAAECVPFAKSGGLGDVVGVLPEFLGKAGCNVTVVMPLYSLIDRKKFNVVPELYNFEVIMGQETIKCNVAKTIIDENVDVWFIDYEPFFGRPNLYHDDKFIDYEDNPKRFMFLSMAALLLCREIGFMPDIVHAHDWHTAILPAYLKRLFIDDQFFHDTATVLTIHNIAYQGRYHRAFFGYSGLDLSDFTPDKFECHNAINLLKGGIQFADVINTVSKGYADETRSNPGGHGLEQFLNEKGIDYVGILNGADYSQWNPETDTLIAANYSGDDLKGKHLCKDQLQQEFGLNPSREIAVIGIVSRLVEQKGFQILIECIDAILTDMDVQFVILGEGQNYLEWFFSALPERHPGKAGTYIGYSNELAHHIEAGSDMFLMPSLYEPCGLNQIYSLKYGTLPIVRATGGLKDTVENYNQDTGGGTGFVFHEPDSKALYNTIGWAVDTYYNRRDDFSVLVKRAMEQNFPWETSTEAYLRLYLKALEKVRKGFHAVIEL